MKRLLFLLLLALAWAGRPAAHAVDAEVRQLIVAVAPEWNSTQGRLCRFSREGAKGEWRREGAPVAVLFGRNGLAWGRGIRGDEEPGLRKRERDGRAPAGVFHLGTIYTYDAALPAGSQYPFHIVNEADAWVDDPASPDYNRHIAIADPAHPPAWFDQMKMRHGDFAYRWLVEIRHNSDPPQSGAGSAIFFHLRRGQTRPTSGCTSMAEPDLVNLIRWLRADRRPAYALLPREEYGRKWRAWGLPDPAMLE